MACITEQYSKFSQRKSCFSINFFILGHSVNSMIQVHKRESNIQSKSFFFIKSPQAVGILPKINKYQIPLYTMGF